MISTLEGIIESKSLDSVVINVSGVGYEVNISTSTYNRLPTPGKSVKLLIIESTGMYGGGVNLYGFLTTEEKAIFISFKNSLKNTGAKKALEYLDKAMKSLADFRRAVVNKDLKLLTSIFGFHRQTAEKIIAGLQDKLDDVKISGKEKWVKVPGGVHEETIQALVTLGLRESQARFAVEEAMAGLDKVPSTAELITLALKHYERGKNYSPNRSA